MGLPVCHNWVGHTKQPTTAGSSPLCTCAACPTDTVASQGRLVRATVKVTAVVAGTTSTAWWRSADHPPPAAWRYVFEEFTGDDTADEWALAAAIFVAQYRRRHSRGPTFRELFAHLLPDTGGVPSPLPAHWDAPERRHATTAFRRIVVIEWRRRGFVSFDKHLPRSLRVGPNFRAQSRALNTHARSSRLRCVDEPTPPTTLQREVPPEEQVDPSPPRPHPLTRRRTHPDVLAVRRSVVSRLEVLLMGGLGLKPRSVCAVSGGHVVVRA